ncbi:hypothetical protein HJG60_010737 [Phyllostomus discolor]|uniref:Uncharacterized protein n=1 Tax=Phyllostomus discolor TaxID=89673 RepID=A0A834ECM2_9CHIR|nr:hypothetical protein HJG60_010737 [Phyllostomus discolor]
MAFVAGKCDPGSDPGPTSRGLLPCRLGWRGLPWPGQFWGVTVSWRGCVLGLHPRKCAMSSSVSLGRTTGLASIPGEVSLGHWAGAASDRAFPWKAATFPFQIRALFVGGALRLCKCLVPQHRTWLCIHR